MTSIRVSPQRRRLASRSATGSPALSVYSTPQDVVEQVFASSPRPQESLGERYWLGGFEDEEIEPRELQAADDRTIEPREVGAVDHREVEPREVDIAEAAIYRALEELKGEQLTRISSEPVEPMPFSEGKALLGLDFDEQPRDLTGFWYRSRP